MKNKNIALLIIVILLLIIGSYYFLRNDKNGVEVINSKTDNASTTTATGTAKTTTTSGTTRKTGVSQTYPSNTVKIGQRTLINGIYVTPQKVTYDGRCPIDVKCIQAGTVDLGVLLEEGALTQSVIITLNKPTLFMGNTGNKTVILTNVYPSKTSTKTLKPSDYRFVITVK